MQGRAHSDLPYLLVRTVTHIGSSLTDKSSNSFSYGYRRGPLGGDRGQSVEGSSSHEHSEAEDATFSDLPPTCTKNSRVRIDDTPGFVGNSAGG